MKVLNRWREWHEEGDWKTSSFWFHVQRMPLSITVAGFGVVSMYLGNVWAAMYEANSFFASFPIMTFVFSHYLAFTLVMGFSGLMVLFMANRSGGYG